VLLLSREFLVKLCRAWSRRSSMQVRAPALHPCDGDPVFLSDDGRGRIREAKRRGLA